MRHSPRRVWPSIRWLVEVRSHGLRTQDVGHEANTDYLSEDIKRDELGRLSPSDLPRGMFVAGDVRSELKMQIATAVGTGCTTAMDAIAYLNTNAQ